MTWVIDKNVSKNEKYKWAVGYWLNGDVQFYNVFEYETLKSAVRMLNYINGGTGECDEFLLEDNS